MSIYRTETIAIIETTPIYDEKQLGDDVYFCNGIYEAENNPITILELQFCYYYRQLFIVPYHQNGDDADGYVNTNKIHCDVPPAIRNVEVIKQWCDFVEKFKK